jgi:serine protein kinase
MTTVTTGKPLTEEFLEEAEGEFNRFEWEGTFAEYLRMVGENPSIARLSHRLLHDAVTTHGVEASRETGQPDYSLFKDRIYGLDRPIERIMEQLASSAGGSALRKRVLLLIGPPASGKSAIAALMKDALERFTRADAGAVYAIKGCPMQEEPLHLIPHSMRQKLLDEHGICIEGDLCPRCRYVVRTRYDGKISGVPVKRVVFSEQQAIGIGSYDAANASDTSLLVGSVDTSQLPGDRLEMAGSAFRLDGAMNVANRGILEIEDVFKASSQLLATIMGLARQQLIRMDRLGSVYADEVVIAYSSEEDFKAFLADSSYEPLRGTVVPVRVPYNLRLRDEVKIYQRLLKTSGLDSVHIPALTLPTVSSLAVLSRLDAPTTQGASLMDKLRAYDGQWVEDFSQADVEQEKRSCSGEGMKGLSPRFVMNRLIARASSPGVRCISPLNALDSLWQGAKESGNLTEEESEKLIALLETAVSDYNERAIREVQIASVERFEESASAPLSQYLSHVSSIWRAPSTESVKPDAETEMREMEKYAGISEKAKNEFRLEIFRYFDDMRKKGIAFDHTSESRIKAAIENRLLPDSKVLRSELAQPRSSERAVEWRRKRGAIRGRLINDYSYCPQCAEDTVEYVVHLLHGNDALKTSKSEIEWRWELNPVHYGRSQPQAGEQ